MTFLAPIYLLLGGAVAVPLVLHLMRRRIHQRVDFPAVRYLARAERENVRQLKLRNMMLMVLRTLIVLTLAVAAARPLAALFGVGHAPTAVAIVLDNSMSTGVVVNGAPVYASLQSRAVEVVERSNPSDRLWLITADGRVVGGTRDAIREAIGRTEVVAARGDLSGAVSRAAGVVVASGMASRQIAVITDGQASAWQDIQSLGDVHVAVWLPSGDPPANRGVVLAEPRPVRWTPSGSVVAKVLAADSATYRVALGGRRLTSGTARGGADIVVHSSAAERGWQSGVIELEPDELRLDDARYFAVWVGDAPGVQVAPEAGSFVRPAIDALQQSSRARVGTDVWIGPADLAPRLPALLLAPSDPARVGAANRNLERLGVPWRFGALRRDPTEARGARFAGVSVSAWYPLQTVGVATADTVATAGGSGWMIVGDRYALVGSPLDPAATTLPVSAAFVPWLGDLLAQRLAVDASTVLYASPGARLILPAGVDGLEDDAGKAVSGTRELAPTRPGVYYAKRGNSRVAAVVVNPDAAESDLARLQASELRARFGAANATVTGDSGRWRSALFDVGGRRPLQGGLLVLALLLLAAEVAVVRRSERLQAA